MAQVGNTEDRFGGEFMIQDRDHMSEVRQTSVKGHRGGNRQSEQSHTESRQQGGDEPGTNRQQGDRRRQSH